MKYLLLIFCLSLAAALNAQNDGTIAHFMHAPQMYNPAYVGSNNHWGFTMLAKQQWPGIANNPKSNTLCIEMPFKQQKIGAGLRISSQKTGFTQNNKIFADYSFAIQMPNNAFLRMGISAGVSNYSENFENAKTIRSGDPAFLPDNTKLWLPNIALGLYYHTPNTYLSLSAPTLLLNQTPPHNNTFRIQSLVFSSKTTFFLSNSLSIMPAILAIYNTQSPVIAGINISLLLAQKVEIGASYFTSNIFSPGINAMFYIDPNFKIGYHYLSDKHSGINHFNNGTHEMLIAINFNYITTHFSNPNMF